MQPLPASAPRARQPSRTACVPCGAGARRSSSPIVSPIRSAGKILVMEGGEIVERGTHAELLAKHGRYRQLYDKQYRFEQDRFVNPGEDFTPEPEAPVVTAPVTPPTRL